ncbi:MAG: amidohydrolase family protein [Anaerolineae bacterium]|jgi:hypothetical protein|nr:amidohydrolase family protein [Chloroflexota bacterium]
MSDPYPQRGAGYVDAYMHVGAPRFGTAAQALAACDRWGTAAAVLVLGPRVPDIAALVEAQRTSPDRFRAVGIPFGDTADRRLACVEATLEAGAIGIRMQGDELLQNPVVLARLGESGRWIYATDPLASERHTATLLEWLARYPTARVGAPHCLRPTLAPLDDPLAEELFRHPRFFAILSRQGQAGSSLAWPWEDLRPWVQRLLAWCGQARMLWGSEYPVIYWRGEQIDGTRRWLTDIAAGLDAEALSAVLGGNARRLFFQQPAPPVHMPQLPLWLADYPPPGPVPLEPTRQFQLPIELYQPLYDQYAEQNCPEHPLSMAEFVLARLRAGLGLPDAGGTQGAAQ